ncbi:hypothetical protein BUALT_Bualt11G0124100 [Buddleja alternifolia]|uniref:PTBP1-like RNA recognition motif 2 domain-containing protein n=1 Tax=Buddleja alternifolia TaxID=168488 RepID=A0AAV6X5C8_9LAMI|nr:hypothetical protein BUALT_Bualt11G0124100 [Buddleja alternifolia]
MAMNENNIDYERNLIVTIYDAIHPITVEVLHQLFDPFGIIEKIEIFPRSNFQALVSYQWLICSHREKFHLHGHRIYDCCCIMDIQYASKSFMVELAHETQFELVCQCSEDTRKELTDIIEKWSDDCKKEFKVHQVKLGVVQNKFVEVSNEVDLFDEKYFTPQNRVLFDEVPHKKKEILLDKKPEDCLKEARIEGEYFGMDVVAGVQLEKTVLVDMEMWSKLTERDTTLNCKLGTRPVDILFDLGGGNPIDGKECPEFGASGSRLSSTRNYVAKDIRFGVETRALMLKDVEELADAVKETMGPKRRNVVIKQSWGAPKVARDGVTVTESIKFMDKVKNIGESLIEQVVKAIHDIAGDGTTCASILTCAIFTKGCKSVVADMNAMDLRRGFTMVIGVMVTNLKNKGKMISTSEKIAQVGTIWANREREIGELITNAMARVDGKTLFNELEVLKLALKRQRPLVIVVENVEHDTLATLILNKLRAGIKGAYGATCVPCQVQHSARHVHHLAMASAIEATQRRAMLKIWILTNFGQN